MTINNQYNDVLALTSYVSEEDKVLTHKQFLFTVALRILDDLGVEHNLSDVDFSDDPTLPG